MTFDPTGADVSTTAGIVVLLFAMMFGLAGSPLGRLFGIHPDGPFLFNPHGVRAISLVVAYPAALVAVWGVTYGLIAPHVETTALPVQAGIAAAGGALLLTAVRYGRFVAFQLGGKIAVEGDLDPDEIVPVDEIGDDVDLAAALEAARRGEWRPAAALLAASGDVDVRMDRIRTLTSESVDDAQWLEEWFAADPHGGLVTALRAELAMQRAWAARGAAHAEHTTMDQFESFGTGLAQAERLAERAVELAPDDPTPWATLVEIARGQGVPQEEFERRVNGLFERAPHHVHGSFAVLQALCAKWMGSHETMFGCARDLAAEAPAGSAVCLLPLMAHVEYFTEVNGGRGGPAAAARHMESGATRTEMRAAVEKWLAGPDGGPRPGSRLFGHNLAAYAFWLAEDRDAALPHLEAIGRSVTELPWAYYHVPGEGLGVVRKWAGLPVVAPRASDLEPFSPA